MSKYQPIVLKGIKSSQAQNSLAAYAQGSKTWPWMHNTFVKDDPKSNRIDKKFMIPNI